MPRAKPQVVQEVLDALFNAHRLLKVTEIMEQAHINHDTAKELLTHLYTERWIIKRKTQAGDCFGLHPKGYKARQSSEAIQQFTVNHFYRPLLKTQDATIPTQETSQ